MTLRPGRPGFPANASENELRIVGEHFAYMQKLTSEGTALLVGRTDASNPLGIALLKVAGPEEAQRVLQQDPAVRQNVMTGEVHPFRLALLGDLNALEAIE
jgi:uncharacterized protein YciI